MSGRCSPFSAPHSVAMLAAFLLAGGGLWLIVRQRDSKKGGLMLVAASVLLANVLIWAV